VCQLRAREEQCFEVCVHEKRIDHWADLFAVRIPPAVQQRGTVEDLRKFVYDKVDARLDGQQWCGVLSHAAAPPPQEQALAWSSSTRLSELPRSAAHRAWHLFLTKRCVRPGP